ncbi:unnamed protein product, partial [Closterium sp. Naga37s-1]
VFKLQQPHGTLQSQCLLLYVTQILLSSHCHPSPLPHQQFPSYSSPMTPPNPNASAGAGAAAGGGMGMPGAIGGGMGGGMGGGLGGGMTTPYGIRPPVPPAPYGSSSPMSPGSGKGGSGQMRNQPRSGY